MEDRCRNGGPVSAEMGGCGWIMEAAHSSSIEARSPTCLHPGCWAACKGTAPLWALADMHSSCEQCAAHTPPTLFSSPAQQCTGFSSDWMIMDQEHQLLNWSLRGHASPRQRAGGSGSRSHE